MPTLECLILEYLLKNPGAADTVEGIVQWWLAGVSPQPRLKDVEVTLERLVERGEISAEGDLTGRIIFRIKR